MQKHEVPVGAGMSGETSRYKYIILSRGVLSEIVFPTIELRQGMVEKDDWESKIRSLLQ